MAAAGSVVPAVGTVGGGGGGGFLEPETTVKVAIIPLVVFFGYRSVKWLHESPSCQNLVRTIGQWMDRIEIVVAWLSILLVLTASSSLLPMLLLLFSSNKATTIFAKHHKNDLNVDSYEDEDDDNEHHRYFSLESFCNMLLFTYGCLLAVANAATIVGLIMYKTYKTLVAVRHSQQQQRDGGSSSRSMVVQYVGTMFGCLLLLGQCHVLAQNDESSLLPVGAWTIGILHSIVRTLGYLSITVLTLMILIRFAFSDSPPPTTTTTTTTTTTPTNVTTTTTTRV